MILSPLQITQLNTTQKLDCIEINILSHYETWITIHIHKLNKKTDLK